jgi:hypothetical protein
VYLGAPNFQFWSAPVLCRYVLNIIANAIVQIVAQVILVPVWQSAPTLRFVVKPRESRLRVGGGNFQAYISKSRSSVAWVSLVGARFFGPAICSSTQSPPPTRRSATSSAGSSATRNTPVPLSSRKWNYIAL